MVVVWVNPELSVKTLPQTAIKSVRSIGEGISF